MSSKNYEMHVISHTHWDREWYQDFQGFRQRLVFQTDSLMDLLEANQGFRWFLMDGQTIWLRDYLQIRPESRDRITRHLRSGAIEVGPWYVMPDELLLSGESLVRNLLLGHKVCAEFGVDPLPVGYVSDIFGHCSQFPQIVRGFGIDTVFLHRGTSNRDGASEMRWTGADGSQVLVIKAYPDSGYNDFLTFKRSDEATLLDYEEKKKSYAATKVLFALDGNDHEPADWTVLDKIARWNSIFKDIEPKHSSMANFLKALKEQLGDWQTRDLVTQQGELRTPMKSGLYAQLFYGTASARVPLKQQNDRMEYLLARTAEPLHAWAHRLGGDSQKAFLDLAWEYLITNHPHDSIVGCSVDQVHKDMIYRFDQARLLGTNSMGESLMAIGDRLDTQSLGESYKAVTVYNPASVDRGPVSEFSFEIYTPVLEENEKAGLVPALFGGDGKLVYFEPVRVDVNQWPTPQVKKIHGESPSFLRIENAYHGHHRFSVRAVAPLAPVSYDSWAIRFVPKDQIAALPDGVQPVEVDSGAGVIENEFVRLTARRDGLIDLLDKTTGVSYDGLHDLEDCGDAGSGWDHVHPENDVVVRASDAGVKRDVRVSVTQSGKLTASAEISYKMRIPAEITRGRKARSEETVDLPVRFTFTITSGSRRIDCEAAITNTARGHRLRALFPTNRRADVWFGDSAFDLVERSIKLPDTTGWQEQAREETPVKNVAAVQDSAGGFALLTKGVCEAAVQDNAERTAALTLFRCFRQQIGDGWTQDSQLQGDLRLEYAIVPFSPTAEAPVFLFDEIDKYKVPTVSLTSPAHPGDLPARGQLISLPAGLVLSTIKTSEDAEAVIVRLFNPSSSVVSGDLVPGVPFTKASRCDMLERPTEVLAIAKGRISITAQPKEVLSIRFE